MSLSRAVYSDGGASGSRYSSANLWKEPTKARRIKKKEEENATRYIWVSPGQQERKQRWMMLRETQSSCSCGRSEQKKEETDAPEQYK